MRKRGFTLIELLAVIVVLAIIALIATPIVMKIISSVQESAAKRSAERYLDAVELAIATEELDNMVADGLYIIQPNGSLCLEGQDCTEQPTIKVEVKGTLPKSGGIIAIQGGKVVSSLSGKLTKMEMDNYVITMDSKGNIKIEVIKKQDVVARISSESNNYVTNALVPVKSSYTSAENAIIDNSNLYAPMIKNLKSNLSKSGSTVSYTFWVRNDGTKKLWLSSIEIGKVLYNSSAIEVDLEDLKNVVDIEISGFSGACDLINDWQCGTDRIIEAGDQVQLAITFTSKTDSTIIIDINDITFNYSVSEDMTPDIIK